jgi:hypothetical protein
MPEMKELEEFVIMMINVMGCEHAKIHFAKEWQDPQKMKTTDMMKVSLVHDAPHKSDGRIIPIVITDVMD